MILNLSKSFHFQKDQNEYNVDYIFKNEISTGSITPGISLVLDVSVNEKQKTTYKLNKPTATLYQSNEDIEKMIRQEIISFSN